ncbi:S41 family peptidase [Aliikangiella sp. IMCC44359]|uniref:S41 family peptidase n=1 Tax=Aliikangiella sp. IMCC44359 TaxID=3459125 RepID=UPI00403AC083
MGVSFRSIFIIVGWLGLVGCASINRSTSESDLLDKKVPLIAVSSTQISPDLLREELDFLKRKLVAIHPEPFARIHKSDFENLFNQVKASLTYPMSKAEFYFRIAPLLASLRDVHSFINLPEYNHQQNDGLFPLAVLVEQDSVYVAADLSDQPVVPVGAKLVSINQAPISYLLKSMRSVTAKETKAGQSRRIQLSFAWLLASMGQVNKEFELQYFWQGKVFSQRLKGLPFPKKKKNVSDKQSYYGFSQLTVSTSLLWLNDFNEVPEVFEAFLEDKFNTMATGRVDNLIIDMRYNQGGLSENLKNLLSRLTDKPVYWAQQGIIKISEELKDNHISRTRKRRADKYKWGLQWLPLEWTDQLQHSIWWGDLGDTITLNLEPVEPYGGYKPKKVWVLTNGFCYSACSSFVASINYYKLAKTVGEKTGSFAQYQFAYPIEIKLPHTELIATLPAMRFDFLSAGENELIKPQEEISRTVEEISGRVDPVLNSALREAER